MSTVNVHNVSTVKSLKISSGNTSGAASHALNVLAMAGILPAFVHIKLFK